jgi:6-phosphofructokinase 1
VNPLETPVRYVPEYARKKGAKQQDSTVHIKEVVQRLAFKALIVIGDDDMLRYTAHLSKQGVPIIAIPKTIHNNIYGTDYTIGFSTGLARGVAFIHELRSLAGSREQIVVIETFRVNSGLSTLMAGFLAGVDRVIIPEVPYDPEKLAVLLQRDKALNPSNYAVVLVNDGSEIVEEKVLKYTPHLSARSKSQVLKLMTEDRAREANAEDEFTLDEVVETGTSLAGSGMVVAELMRHLTGDEVFLQPLTYLLRTGNPDGQDLLGATNFAIRAARLLREGKVGRMVAYQQRYNLTDVDLQLVTQGVHGVDVETMYDADEYKPKVNLIWAALEEE